MPEQLDQVLESWRLVLSTGDALHHVGARGCKTSKDRGIVVLAPPRVLGEMCAVCEGGPTGLLSLLCLHPRRTGFDQIAVLCDSRQCQSAPHAAEAAVGLNVPSRGGARDSSVLALS